MLGVLGAGAPLPVQRHHHEHQPLAVEGDPADEEGHHHHHCANIKHTLSIMLEGRGAILSSSRYYYLLSSRVFSEPRNHIFYEVDGSQSHTILFTKECDYYRVELTHNKGREIQSTKLISPIQYYYHSLNLFNCC